MIPIVALVIELGLFATAFAWRTYAHRRATGDTGWRGFSGAPWSIEWLAGHGFALALLLGALAPLAELQGHDPAYDASSVRYFGLGVAATGVALTLLAQTSMGDSWRVGVDEAETTTLRTTGVFAIVRNPIFSATAVTTIGLTIAIPNMVSLAGTVMLIAAIQGQVRRVEEPYLSRTHATAYAAYAQSVGRFIPAVGRSTDLSE